MKRHLPAAALLKAVLLAAIVALGFVAVRYTPLADLLTEERIIEVFQTLRRAWWTPLLVIGLFAFTSPLGVPVSVYMLASAAVFSFFPGVLYNMIGLVLGTATSYYLAKSLGRDFIVFLARGRLRRVERIFERSGFWPLVQIRFMPIPFAIVNFGAALAGVKPPLFLGASTVALIPATLIHTFFFSRLFETTGQERWITLFWYAVVLGVFNVVISYPSIRAAWRRRQRYRQLMEIRQQRLASTGNR